MKVFPLKTQPIYWVKWLFVTIIWIYAAKIYPADPSTILFVITISLTIGQVVARLKIDPEDRYLFLDKNGLSLRRRADLIWKIDYSNFSHVERDPKSKPLKILRPTPSIYFHGVNGDSFVLDDHCFNDKTLKEIVLEIAEAKLASTTSVAPEQFDLHRIPYENLCEKLSHRLQQAGIPLDRANIEAQIMAEADLLETPSHGVRMLPNLLRALEEKRIAPAPELKIERELGAICVLDCGNGPGRYASAKAMDAAIERAQQFGVGVCLAKRTTHWGRAHAYANRAAQQGFIGICTTNAMPTMAIYGAKKPVIGNNPLAIGIPGANTQEPIVLDMAMSQAAVGKVTTWLREGRELPNNWGLDSRGNPTSDAKEILAGAVLPMGEHKGAGLAVMMELLTAALAGAAFTQEIFARDQSGIDADATKIFIALNVDAFIKPAEFAARVADFLNYLESEASPFQYPGERGWKMKQKNVVEGVPLHKEIVEHLRQVGIDL